MAIRKTSSRQNGTSLNDDLSYRGPIDRIRINIKEPWERNRWARRFTVTASELQEAVANVGPLVRKVQVYLASRRLASKRDPVRRVSKTSVRRVPKKSTLTISRRDPTRAKTRRGLAQHIAKEYTRRSLTTIDLQRDYKLSAKQAKEIWNLAGERGQTEQNLARGIESILFITQPFEGGPGGDPAKRKTSEAQREADLFRSELSRAEKLPLADRKVNLQQFASEVNADPNILGQFVGWLLDGSYGHGAYVKAQEVIRNKRLNREAWLVQTVAALEWGVPQRMVAQWWNSLPRTYQDKINHVVRFQIPPYTIG